MVKKKEEVFQPSGDVSRVQSLGGRRWVRIFDHHGKAHHLAVVDDGAIGELVLEIKSENEPIGNRIAAELAALGIETSDESEVPAGEPLSD